MLIKQAVTKTEAREAWFSDDELYRYLLDIVWDLRLDRIAVIGLNPSTADHLQNDNTMTRITGFAKDWGFGGFRMLNAFALRSTDPNELFKARDPIGPDNTIEFLKDKCFGHTFAAWGGTIQKRKWAHWYRGLDIALAIPHIQCFRYTTKGHPEHPLYLPKTVTPSPFCYPGAS